jgi:hypothetical protein
MVAAGNDLEARLRHTAELQEPVAQPLLLRHRNNTIAATVHDANRARDLRQHGVALGRVAGQDLGDGLRVARAGDLAQPGLDDEGHPRKGLGIDGAAEIIERANPRIGGGGAQRPHAADADPEQADPRRIDRAVPGKNVERRADHVVEVRAPQDPVEQERLPLPGAVEPEHGKAGILQRQLGRQVLFLAAVDAVDDDDHRSRLARRHMQIAVQRPSLPRHVNAAVAIAVGERRRLDVDIATAAVETEFFIRDRQRAPLGHVAKVGQAPQA